jgi:hypothetical protein
MEQIQSQYSAFRYNVDGVILIVSTNPCGVHGTRGNGAFFLGSGRRATLNAGGLAPPHFHLRMGEHHG